MCTFYILKSALLNTLYVSHTCDSITERLRKHTSNHKGLGESLVRPDSYRDNSSDFQKPLMLNFYLLDTPLCAVDSFYY